LLLDEFTGHLTDKMQALATKARAPSRQELLGWILNA